MKYTWSTLAVLVVLAAGLGWAVYRLSGAPAVHAAVAQRDALAWLRADFHLSDAQFEAIKRLHDEYAPSCEEHCRRIQEATQALAAQRAGNGADPAAAAAAERRLNELRETCETAISAHVRQVAAAMSPADGARYLALVLPKIAAFDHRHAPSLDLAGKS